MEPVRIGIASIAHMHAMSYAASARDIADIELAAIWDDDPERGGKTAEHFGTEYIQDLDRFLAQELDGVIVCSENVRHRELTLASLAAGKHVMCEKPIATTLEDASAMTEAAKQYDRLLVTAFPCRFSPAMQRLRAVVKSGELGEIVGIAGTNRGTMPGGWFTQKELSGGGAVIDHTVHVVDLLRWLLDDELTSVYAEISNRMHGQEFDDTGLLSMRFGKGVFATLDTSWSRPKSFPTWGDVTLEVAGTAGTASLDMFNQKLLGYNDSTMKFSHIGYGSNIDEGLVRAFANACVTGERPPELASGEDGLKALRAALAAYESDNTRQSVSLPISG